MSYRREWVGDAPPRGGDDSRADFSAWERKVLLLTDQLCTRLTLTLHVVAMPFLFGPWAARPVTSLADDLSRVWSNALVTATLVALAWVMRASDARGAARPKAAVDAAISRVLSEVCRRGTLSQW